MLSAWRRPTTLSRLSQQARSSRLLHCPVVPRTPPTTNPAGRVRQLCSEPTPPPKGFGKFYKHKPGAAAEAETAGKDGPGKGAAASEGRAAEASEGAREGAKGEASGEGGGLGGGGGMHGGSGGGGESSGPGQPMMQAQAALSLALLWGLYQLSEGARGNAQASAFPDSRLHRLHLLGPSSNPGPLSSAHLTPEQEITFADFRRELLESGEVDRIVIINKAKARPQPAAPSAPL